MSRKNAVPPVMIVHPLTCHTTIQGSREALHLSTKYQKHAKRQIKREPFTETLLTVFVFVCVEVFWCCGATKENTRK